VPQSGNASSGKMFPNALIEDQEAIEMAEAEPVVLSTAPYSSPDPETDGIRMVPLDDQTSTSAAGAEKSGDADDKNMKAGEWKDLVDEAQDSEALSAVEQRYLDAEADFKTVEDAIEKKREELSNGNDE
jgi:hypothetical protein